MTAHGYPASVDDINLSDWEFWRRPLAEREAAFALLCTHKPVAFYEEGETSFNIPDPGYWRLRDMPTWCTRVSIRRFSRPRAGSRPMIDLPDCRTRSGFENLSFDFAQSGLRDAGQYVVIVALPWYPVARIRTGQRHPAGGWSCLSPHSAIQIRSLR